MCFPHELLARMLLVPLVYIAQHPQQRTPPSGRGSLMGHHRQSGHRLARQWRRVTQVAYVSSHASVRHYSSQEHRIIVSTHRTPRRALGERTHPGEAWDWDEYKAQCDAISHNNLMHVVGLPVEVRIPTQREMAVALEMHNSEVA